MDPDRWQLILGMVGDNGFVVKHASAIWAKAGRYAQRTLSTGDVQYPDLFDLYARQFAIEVLQGSVRGQFDFSEKDRAGRPSQKMAALSGLLRQTQAEISDMMAQLQAVSGAYVRDMAAQAPIESPSGWPDANDRRYSGDPNKIAWPVQIP